LGQVGMLVFVIYTAYENLFVGARVVLFVAFLMAFGSLIGGAWVLFGYYVPYKSEKIYPGIAIFSQNLAIFIRFVFFFSYFNYLFSFYQYIDSEIWPQRRS